MKGGDDFTEAVILPAFGCFRDESCSKTDADVLGAIREAKNDQIAQPRLSRALMSLIQFSLEECHQRLVLALPERSLGASERLVAAEILLGRLSARERVDHCAAQEEAICCAIGVRLRQLRGQRSFDNTETVHECLSTGTDDGFGDLNVAQNSRNRAQILHSDFVNMEDAV